MRIDAIAIGRNPPDDVNVIIEVGIGGEPIKYEMDKEAGTLVVDRFLHTPMRYPGNYGFVPHTLSEDGDPIDVLVANTRPIIPGAVMNVRPVGVLKMEDDGGGDEKIIAVPSPHLTKRYLSVLNYTDLPQITLEQIQHFFEHYKDLEPGKWVKLAGWGDAAEGREFPPREPASHPKPHPPFAQVVEHRRLFGDTQRVVPGQDHGRGAQIDIGAGGGEPGHQLQIVRAEGVVVEMVLNRPQHVEPQVRRHARELQFLVPDLLVGHVGPAVAGKYHLQTDVHHHLPHSPGR